MKKRLEAELISIAHRILKLKSKSEVDQLYKETQKLYETLSVLKFYQDNFEMVKADISQDVLEEKLENQIIEEVPQKVVFAVNEEETVGKINSEPEEEIEQIAIEEEVAIEEDEIHALIDEEDSLDEDKEEPVFKPIFELENDENISDNELADKMEQSELESEIKSETKQVSFEELLGGNYADTEFVKPNEISLFSNESSGSDKTKEAKHKKETDTATLNTTSSKLIEIGLNDRVAFVNNLFGESNEDFNRVISQINTFDSLEEAKNFINEMVIPDYNYWVGKEEYLERFMEVVEKKFA